jgi:predicted GNAT family N-acyltransferase
MPAFPSQYAVQRVSWDEAGPALASVRHAVFVVEQHVPEDLEWDEHDRGAVHVLARAPDGSPIGTGRLLPDGRIGRMAVLPAWRKLGVGSAILTSLLEVALERAYPETRLHAQTHAVDFYGRHGFVCVGEQFMEAGIPHREMVRRGRSTQG